MLNFKNNPSNIGKLNFLLYSNVPNYPTQNDEHLDVIQTAFILYTLFQDPKTPPTVLAHPSTNQTAKIWSLELENTRSLWKIFIESEKNIKILE